MDKHDYKISELGLTETTRRLGIIRAELRQCNICGYANTYVNINGKESFLFKEKPCTKP
jgi:hypothetical protein